MALISGSDSLNSSFTPGVGDFVPTVSGGQAILERQAATGAPWSQVGVIQQGDAVIVNNPLSGINYRFRAAIGSPAVRADQ